MCCGVGLQKGLSLGREMTTKPFRFVPSVGVFHLAVVRQRWEWNPSTKTTIEHVTESFLTHHADHPR
jgi:hypothetical protein